MVAPFLSRAVVLLARADQGQPLRGKRILFCLRGLTKVSPYGIIPFMPTVRENIAYTFEHFMLVYRGTLLKVARAVAIIALIALALEVFVFNINFFTSSGYRTINLDDRIQLQRNDEGAFLLTDVDHTLEFSSLNLSLIHI